MSERNDTHTTPAPFALTLDQIAEEVCLGRKTVERWHLLGIIPGRIAMPGGRTVRYQRELVLRWLRQGCPGS
jgi:hypothetical protein